MCQSSWGLGPTQHIGDHDLWTSGMMGRKAAVEKMDFGGSPGILLSRLFVFRAPLTLYNRTAIQLCTAYVIFEKF
jgi:hypothetical protein